MSRVCVLQASTMQPSHVIAALKELEFTELADEMEAHQREWESGERPKGMPPDTVLRQTKALRQTALVLSACLSAAASRAWAGASATAGPRFNGSGAVRVPF